MNRDVTQRLLKESIICLCRSHIFTAGGLDSDFEIDGLICISHGREGGDSDQQMVFKIHELVHGDGSAKNDNFANPHRFGGGSQMRRDVYSNNRGTLMGSHSRNSQLMSKSNGVSAGSLVQEYSNGRNNEIIATPAATMSGRKRKITSPRHCPPLINHSFIELHSKVPSKSIPEGETGNVNVIKEELEWQGDDETIQNYFNNNDADVQTTNGSENERMFSCARCSFKCEIQEDVEDHVKLKHNASEAYVCPGCGIAYESEALFLKHSASSNCTSTQFHGTVGASDNQTERTSSVEQKTIDSGTARSNRRAGSLSCDEEKEYTAAPSVALNDEFDMAVDDDEEESLDQSKPRACTECGVKFADFPALNVHSSNAHRLFPCPYCPRTFAQESQRESHLFEHTGESLIECGSCHLSFSRVDSLTRHLAKAHGINDTKRETTRNVEKNEELNWNQIRGLLPLSQSDTDAVTAIPNVLLTASEFLERVTNFGVDPAIEISDEDDETNAASTIGSSVIALDPWRTFLCEICSEHFTSVASYTEHCGLVHRRIPCPYCGATFTQKASMERHQRQHTGVKPFRCTICANSFTRKETLVTHVARMHPVLDYGLY